MFSYFQINFNVLVILTFLLDFNNVYEFLFRF